MLDYKKQRKGHLSFPKGLTKPWDEMLLLPGQTVPIQVFVPNWCHREHIKHQGSKTMKHRKDAGSAAKRLYSQNF